MFHIVLHLVVPLLAALVFYRSGWIRASLTLIATMLVDLDHLLATPLYDPERCSIGFHPLHGAVAIAIYAAMFLLPLLTKTWSVDGRMKSPARSLHLVGLGLMIHMALDSIDCLI